MPERSSRFFAILCPLGSHLNPRGLLLGDKTTAEPSWHHVKCTLQKPSAPVPAIAEPRPI